MREALDRIASVGLTLALIENVFSNFGTGESLQFTASSFAAESWGLL